MLSRGGLGRSSSDLPRTMRLLLMCFHNEERYAVDGDDGPTVFDGAKTGQRSVDGWAQSADPLPPLWVDSGCSRVCRKVSVDDRRLYLRSSFYGQALRCRCDHDDDRHWRIVPWLHAVERAATTRQGPAGDGRGPSPFLPPPVRASPPNKGAQHMDELDHRSLGSRLNLWHI
jgi:hypothetical protein